MNITVRLSLILLFFSQVVMAQLPDIKVNGWFCCDLDAAFTAIAEENDLKLEYDKERFSKIEYTDHIMNKPFDLFLEQLCKKHKLKYFINKDSVLYIVDRWVDAGQETLSTTKTYFGPPIKKNFTITGRVKDQETRESLPFVSVVVKGTTIGTTTNVDGYYTLLDVPSDTVTIIYSYLGYYPLNIFLNPETEVENLVVDLKQESVDIQEVTVTGERQDILQVSGNQAGIIKMSPIKLKSLPNLGEKDILRSFQLMPGVSAANENSSGLYIRGGTPDQVLVLYDGSTVYNVEHLFGFFSAFNSNAIKDVQLYKGGFDAKYGGRLAGVVEITGKEGNQKEFNAHADISLMSVNCFVEFPIGEEISVVMAGRRSWQSPVYSKIFSNLTDDNSYKEEQEDDDDDDSDSPPMDMDTDQDTKSYFYDLNTKITYRPNKDKLVALSFYNGKDDLDNSMDPSGSGMGGDFSMESTDLTNWGNTCVSLRYSDQVTDRFYINGLVSYSNYFSYRERSSEQEFVTSESSSSSTSGVVEDNDLDDFTAKMDFEYKLSENQHLEAGVQVIHNDIDYTYKQNDTTTLIDRSTSGQTYTVYLQDVLSFFSDKLVFTPGIRTNYFTPTGKLYYDPRFNSLLRVTDKFRIKASAGKYSQFAKRVTREDITSGSRDFWVLSDDDKLPVSSSIQYVLGGTFETNSMVIDIEGFYKELSNVTEYSLRVSDYSSAGPGGGSSTTSDYSESFYTGIGKAKGVDILAQKKMGDFTGWVGYTWSQVVTKIDAFGDYWYYASNDVTHEFKIVASYKWRMFDIGATWIYATGRPYTYPEGFYKLTLLDGTTEQYINASVKNGSRLPNYHRLDLSATMNFILGRSAPASLGVSLFNTYNRANVWYMEYAVVDNAIAEIPVYYLGITPNVNLTINLK